MHGFYHFSAEEAAQQALYTCVTEGKVDCARVLLAWAYDAPPEYHLKPVVKSSDSKQSGDSGAAAMDVSSDSKSSSSSSSHRGSKLAGDNAAAASGKEERKEGKRQPKTKKQAKQAKSAKEAKESKHSGGCVLDRVGPGTHLFTRDFLSMCLIRACRLENGTEVASVSYSSSPYVCRLLTCCSSLVSRPTATGKVG